VLGRRFRFGVAEAINPYPEEPTTTLKAEMWTEGDLPTDENRWATESFVWGIL